MLTLEQIAQSTQKVWSLEVDLHRQSEFQRDLRMEGQNRDVVRVNALALPHAGDWLNAVPSTVYNLKMKTREFIPLVKFRLGMNQYRSEGKCPVCNDTSDARGDHSLNCRRGGGEMTARHHHLRNILHATAAAAHLNPSKEEQGIIPNCGDRPADVYIPGWKAGRDVTYDVTVINNLRKDLVNRVVENPRHALEFAKREKNRKYQMLCEQEAVFFVPLPVKVFGGWEDDAVKEIGSITNALARQQGMEEAQVRCHTFQRLSIALQKANAGMWTAKDPVPVPAEVSGDP